MLDSEVVASKDEVKSFNTDSDYYDLKRYLETKQIVKEIFANPERAKALRGYIANKNSIKDEMTKITEDESYAKGLGL